MTMQKVKWWSQPVPPEGYSDSEGIKRQLGVPRLDPLTLLVRETAQNSCDAALKDGGDIDFSVRLQTLTSGQREAWNEFLLPEPKNAGLGISDKLSKSPFILVISDRGTTGLGGVLRSDEDAPEGERKDFVNFMRNVGANKNVHLGGGSYGFGKGVLYRQSLCHAVIADSVCRFRGSLQRRLMGAALGQLYKDRKVLHTGRHWLGGMDRDGYASPLLDGDAKSLADSLGLPGFAGKETGTTVVVVAPDLATKGGKSKDPQSAVDLIASSILWHLWPRMLSGRESRLNPSVWLDDQQIELPDPEELPELWPFTSAYRKVLRRDESEVPVRKQAPKEIGRFAVSQGMAPVWENELLGHAAPFQGRARHCVRMRQADLVVDYFPGEPIPNERIQYGAVFRASAEADEFFTRAEPPAHDDWVLTGLTGTARGVVQLGNAFIREKMRSVTSATDKGEAVVNTPLGNLSRELAKLIVTASGDSATASGQSRGGSANGTGHAKSRVPKIITGPSLVEHNDETVIQALVELPAQAKGYVQIVAQIVLEGDGTVDELGGAQPDVLGWTSDSSGRHIRGRTLPLSDAGGERRWQIAVRPVPDTVTRVSVRITEEDEA